MKSLPRPENVGRDSKARWISYLLLCVLFNRKQTPSFLTNERVDWAKKFLSCLVVVAVLGLPASHFCMLYSFSFSELYFFSSFFSSSLWFVGSISDPTNKINSQRTQSWILPSFFLSRLHFSSEKREHYLLIGQYKAKYGPSSVKQQ